MTAAGVGKMETAHTAGVVDLSRRGEQKSGVGKTFQRESFAHPAPADDLPTPERRRGGQKDAPKKRGRPSMDKRGGWIEFPVKSGKRYPRRRQWKKVDGQWRKVSLGKATELELMSEQEYREYADKRDRARAARRKYRHN